MTCKDCLHYEVCIRRQNSISLDPMKSGFKCPEFKNKADFAEVKHGYWIRHIDDIFPANSTLECSMCHEEECIFLCGDNYCPNCGAKMEAAET